MREFIFFGILIITVILMMLFLSYKHLPKQPLSYDVKKQILDNGFIHFTRWDCAQEIQKEGLVPGKRKAMNIFEKNMVWMYIYNAKEFQQKCDIVHSKGDRSTYDTVVIFKDIEEEQTSHMKYRKNDMAVVYKGIFNTTNVNIKKLEQVDNEDEA